MAQLVKLAKRFQRALDSVSEPLASPSTDADAAGRALLTELNTVEQSSPGIPSSRFLEPLVLKTQLVPSIVAYLERIPWAAATPEQFVEMLSSSAAFAACADMLALLSECPCKTADGKQLQTTEDNSGSRMAATLLRQVRLCFA